MSLNQIVFVAIPENKKPSCNTKRWSWFYVISDHAVCLTGDCLSTVFSSRPLSLSQYSSLSVGSLPVSCLTLNLLHMNIYLTRPFCTYYLPINSKSIQEKDN